MEIRGERECQECGERWSYYETGSVTCPACGSMHSVGVDDRTQHTDAEREFDLTDVRTAAGSGPLRDAAERAKDTAAEYARGRGFIRGGDLLDLDDTYLAARELRHAASMIERGLAPAEDEEFYFLTLLRNADDGERPDPADVPESMREARGLAYANAVNAYLDDLRSWMDERETPADAGSVLETLRDHVKRMRALDGDVAPENADRLVDAANELAEYLRSGDEDALEQARAHLSRLG